MITQRSRAGRYAPDWSGDSPASDVWKLDGLCAQTDPELFFPEKGGSTREAKRICTTCEVRAECLEYALERDERFGIWGGLSERERQRLKRTGEMPAARLVPAAARNAPVACDCDLPSCSGLVARETARRHRARADRRRVAA